MKLSELGMSQVLMCYMERLELRNVALKKS